MAKVNTQPTDFADLMNRLCEEQHERMFAQGFWEGLEGQSIGTKIALICGELSGEFLEAYRQGKSDEQDKDCEGFSNGEIELADAVIRIMDLAGALGYQLGHAIEAKMEFNRTRPPKHGKNF